MDPARVRQLLFPPSSSSEVDADLMSYLASFELEDHEQAVQDVDEICASACPAFAALPEAERTGRVLEFLSALAGGGDGGGDAGASTAAQATKQPTSATDPADAAAAAAAAALAAALKDLSTTTATSEKQDAPRRSTNSADGDDASADDADAATIDALADLIPVPDRASARQFAAHVLRDRCSGDADAAGEYLLSLADDDAGDGSGGRLAAAVQEHRRLARAREEEAAREALARERERQATLERFAWRPDSTSGGGGGGPGGKPPPEANKRGSEGGGSRGGLPRVRYLDGVVVTTKGEKHVVVNQKEEWDGGSRGKVKTKGKRGVGFA
jgi:hypothetical protein